MLFVVPVRIGDPAREYPDKELGSFCSSSFCMVMLQF